MTFPEEKEKVARKRKRGGVGIAIGNLRECFRIRHAEVRILPFCKKMRTFES